MKPRRHYLWRYLSAGALALLVMLVFFLLNAGSWLESQSGRKLLQRELGNVLGMQAGLRGEYSFQLFPLIRVAGGDLVLNDAVTGLPIVSADAYEIQLAFRPLLRKEVSILKVAIHEGTLDIDRLAEFNSTTGANSKKGFQLPSIRDLEITGLQLQKSAADFLMISELKLNDFAEKQRSGITVVLALDQNPAVSEKLRLQGFLQVSASPLGLNLLVEELSLQLQEKSWSVGKGELNWSADQQRLWGELRGFVASYSSHYEFSVLLADGVQIALTGDLQSVDKESIAIGLTARDLSGDWMLESVDLNLAGQEVTGTGCFSTNASPLLQLHMEAGKLDLDVLQNLLPPGLLPAAPDAEGEAYRPPVTASPQLPMLLAIALHVEQLSWSGTVASGVRLVIGEEPECALIEPAALN